MIERIYEHCRTLPGNTESFPFGEDVLVLKVGGRIYALVNLRELPLRVNLKCDPFRAVELREAYPSIQPGFHMNKRHWNTCVLDSGMNETLLIELIDHSYDLVFGGLRKKDRERILSGPDAAP